MVGEKFQIGPNLIAGFFKLGHQPPEIIMYIAERGELLTESIWEKRFYIPTWSWGFGSETNYVELFYKLTLRYFTNECDPTQLTNPTLEETFVHIKLSRIIPVPLFYIAYLLQTLYLSLSALKWRIMSNHFW